LLPYPGKGKKEKKRKASVKGEGWESLGKKLLSSRQNSFKLKAEQRKRRKKEILSTFHSNWKRRKRRK